MNGDRNKATREGAEKNVTEHGSFRKEGQTQSKL